ncbi:MAG: hypothetical protein KJO80_04510, partial [Gammaproteobacteria bacterium]|nr:hypothetical protein [Gammaproteobacteria bacterium]
MEQIYARFSQVSIFFLCLFMMGCSPSDEPQPSVQDAVEPAPAPEPVTDDLETSVARMAAIGYSFGASFSPDGTPVVFISSGAGVPLAWTAGSVGSGLSQLTDFDEPVGGVAWSP